MAKPNPLPLHYRFSQINLSNYRSPYDMKIAQYSKAIIHIMEEEGKELSEIPFEYSNAIFNILFYAFNKGARKKYDLILIKHYLINFPNLIKTIYQKKVFYDANELLNKIALFLKCEEIKKNTLICRLGEIGDKFYLIFRGTVGILLPREYKDKMTEYEYINHLNLLYKHKEYELILRTIASNNHIYRSLEIFEMRNKLENNIDLYYAFELKEMISVNDYINRLTPKQPDDMENREGKVNQVMLWKYLCVTSISEGQTFGDIALSDVMKRRTATIISLETTYCGTLEISVYKNCIRDAQDKIRKMNVNVLLSTCVFSGIGTETFERKHFNYFRNLKMARGEKLFTQGSSVNDIYFIKEGEIAITFKGSFDFINKIILSKGGNVDINQEMMMIKRCSAFEKFYYDTSQIHPLISISQKEIIGLDEYQYENIYFCEGKCFSEKAEIFAIDINFFKEIIKTEKREAKIKEHEKIKNAIILDRLKQIKETKTMKRYETFYTIPTKRSHSSKAKQNIKMLELKTMKINTAKLLLLPSQPNNNNTQENKEKRAIARALTIHTHHKAITEEKESLTTKDEKGNELDLIDIIKRGNHLSISINPSDKRERIKKNAKKMKQFIMALKQCHQNKSESLETVGNYQRSIFDKVIKRANSGYNKTKADNSGTQSTQNNIIDIMGFDKQIEQIEVKKAKRSNSETKMPKIMRLIQTNTKPLVRLIKPPRPKIK